MKWLRQIIIVLIAGITLSGCSFNFLEYKAKSGLQVITNDQPSAVFLNGQYINKTPLIEKNLKPGSYHVLIQPEDSNLVPYETEVLLRKGLLTVITWKPDIRPELSSGVILELETLKDKNKTEVSFNSIPDGAIINVGSTKEFSPAVISDLPTGVQEFEVTLPSYETQHHSINVQAGYRTIVTVKLGKLLSPSDTVPEANADTANPAEASPGGEIAVDVTTDTAASSSGTIKILKTGFTQDGQEVLRVRSAPDTTGSEVGFAPVGNTYPYLGEQKGGWYKISFNETTAWVNGAYAQLQQ